MHNTQTVHLFLSTLDSQEVNLTCYTVTLIKFRLIYKLSTDVLLNLPCIFTKKIKNMFTVYTTTVSFSLDNIALNVVVSNLIVY